jgi:hypothetical protein
MGNKNLTAVDWLIQTLESDIKVDESNMVTIKMHEHDYIKSKQIALEMEKEQIINAYDQGDIQLVNAEQYYKETYESKESDDHIGDVREMVEISDEEIIKLSNEHILYNDSKRQWVIEGMKLYKKQLKTK